MHVPATSVPVFALSIRLQDAVVSSKAEQVELGEAAESGCAIWIPSLTSRSRTSHSS